MHAFTDEHDPELHYELHDAEDLDVDELERDAQGWQHEAAKLEA